MLLLDSFIIYQVLQKINLVKLFAFSQQMLGISIIYVTILSAINRQLAFNNI